MRDASEAIERAGADLVVIGNGAPNFIAGFRDKSGYAGELYTNPDLSAYRELGLARGIARALDPRAALRAVAALRTGFRQSGVHGDAWQLGGVFVIRRGGAIAYAYRSRFAGDHPPVAAVLTAVESLDASDATR